MKSEKRSGSLFSLLARNYLLFTLTLLLIAGGVYLMWNAHLDSAFKTSDWDTMLASKELKSGDYEKLDRYASGWDCAYAVFDGEGKPLYSTSGSGLTDLTEGEIACIPEYGANEYIESVEYTAEGGEVHYILSEYSFNDDGSSEKIGDMVLDSSYRVVSGGFGDGRESYTPREYSLLTGTSDANYEFYKRGFTDKNGQTLTLIMKSAYLKAEDYQKYYQSSWRIWLAFIPLCTAAAAAYILWLDRAIRRPLRRLDQAVVAQSEGHPIHVGDCGGPREIRQIGESFDALSCRLAESELERKSLDEGRQKLIADISHDLKTPITVIAGYADAIRDGKVPPEELERYLHAISDKAEALTALINAFHEYSKVEHPDFTVSPVRTDLCEYLREYLAKKYDEIDLAGFTLDVSIPEFPIYCALDEFQFRRALDNLLSNSIRHNRLGTMLFFDVRQTAHHAVICVGDNGCGIPPDRADTIFEPFVVGSDARSSGGSGLGLAITRRIVNMHGGDISLASAPRHGWSTEFTIRLPLDTAK